MEILWEEEGVQFGFKRWHGWAVGVNSKCGVQSKRRCESHESCICIVGFPACWCQIQGGTKWQHSWRHICDYQTSIFHKDGHKWHELLACCLFVLFFGSISVDKACHASCFDCPCVVKRLFLSFPLKTNMCCEEEILYLPKGFRYTVLTL